MDRELDLARTLKAMRDLLNKARRVAEPILRRWEAEDADRDCNNTEKKAA